MARGPVWIEAYEQYLLRKNVCEKANWNGFLMMHLPKNIFSM